MEVKQKSRRPIILIALSLLSISIVRQTTPALAQPSKQPPEINKKKHSNIVSRDLHIDNIALNSLNITVNEGTSGDTVKKLAKKYHAAVILQGALGDGRKIYTLRWKDPFKTFQAIQATSAELQRNRNISGVEYVRPEALQHQFTDDSEFVRKP